MYIYTANAVNSNMPFIAKARAVVYDTSAREGLFLKCTTQYRAVAQLASAHRSGR